MRTLIVDYLTSVRVVIGIFREKFEVENPLRAWRCGAIPKEGWLDAERHIHYSFHGVGCMVETADTVIDFDFGPTGSVGGFDLWRLRRFLESRVDKYPALKSPDEQEAAFSELIERGEVVSSDTLPSPHLFRLRGHKGEWD